MRFVVITYAPLIQIDGKWWGYGPYVREMNLWLRHVSDPVFVCPVWKDPQGLLIEALENESSFQIVPIYDFNLLGWKNWLNAIPVVFWNFGVIVKAMRKADHIHLRVPGNMGLISCLAQIFFPWKKKTAKYAGNWDWNSRQPWSYRLQQYILNSNLLTHRMQVLVYGKWPQSGKNILPFFTATYSEKDMVDSPPRALTGKLKLMFVGALFAGKRPVLSILAVEQLLAEGVEVELNIFGNGPDFDQIEKYIAAKGLQNTVIMHGNQSATVVRQYFQQSHFLVFISESEGWPKVVAESMFWGCLPITTAVSCVPQMVDNGQRGSLVGFDSKEVARVIMNWINREQEYKLACQKAMDWSRQYTLEKFEKEITQLL